MGGQVGAELSPRSSASLALGPLPSLAPSPPASGVGLGWSPLLHEPPIHRLQGPRNHVFLPSSPFFCLSVCLSSNLNTQRGP